MAFALLCMLTIFADQELDLSANLVQGNDTSTELFLENPEVCLGWGWGWGPGVEVGLGSCYRFLL